MAAPIWVGAAIMKWRFGSVKEKTRRFGGFGKTNGVLKKKSGRLFKRIEGSSIKKRKEGA
jgi:hypothetical protein